MNENPEAYLLYHGGWVPAKQLASICGINPRLLRGDDSPIRTVAISGDAGYRHIKCASEEEITHYVNRLSKHAEEEIKHARLIKQLRQNLTDAQLTLSLNTNPTPSH